MFLLKHLAGMPDFKSIYGLKIKNKVNPEVWRAIYRQEEGYAKLIPKDNLWKHELGSDLHISPDVVPLAEYDSNILIFSFNGGRPLDKINWDQVSQIHKIKIAKEIGRIVGVLEENSCFDDDPNLNNFVVDDKYNVKRIDLDRLFLLTHQRTELPREFYLAIQWVRALTVIETVNGNNSIDTEHRLKTVFFDEYQKTAQRKSKAPQLKTYEEYLKFIEKLANQNGFVNFNQILVGYYYSKLSNPRQSLPGKASLKSGFEELTEKLQLL